jgi:pimeloyl-ACP methyl ester carboxylesterase
MSAAHETEDRAKGSILWSSADGLRLHAIIYDPPSATQKLPVLCIPGLTRNARDFEDLAPWLAALGRRVIAIDLRGRGRSQYDPKPANYRAATYAQDVRRLLREQKIDRAHIVGTSLGAIVALTLALGDRSLIAGAVLNDIGPRLGAAGLARIASYAGRGVATTTDWPEAARAVQQAYQTTFPRLTERDWIRLAHRSFKRTEDGQLILDYDPNIVRGGARAPSKLAEMVMWRAFERLAENGPTLVLRGALSDLFEQETLLRMKRVRPFLFAAEIEDVGHAPTLDEPQAREALGAFFSLVD